MSQAKSKRTNGEAFDAAWANLLANEMARPGRPEGEGWRTVSELQAETGRDSVSRLKINLDKLVQAGRMESAVGINGGRRTTFYRPKLSASSKG